jgi:hypothetical protein
MATDKENPFEIMPDNPEDWVMARHLSNLLNWKVVSSRSDKHPEFSYPMGDILFRNEEEAREYIANSEFTDYYMREYGEF